MKPNQKRSLFFSGMVVSQTTLAPAVVSTTASSENTTDVTATPMMFSTLPPGCSGLNSSTCEVCVPGSHYDNGEVQRLGLVANNPQCCGCLTITSSFYQAIVDSPISSVCETLCCVSLYQLTSTCQVIQFSSWDHP